jgi:hypothetical protein
VGAYEHRRVCLKNHETSEMHRGSNEPCYTMAKGARKAQPLNRCGYHQSHARPTSNVFAKNQRPSPSTTAKASVNVAPTLLLFSFAYGDLQGLGLHAVAGIQEHECQNEGNQNRSDESNGVRKEKEHSCDTL